MITAEIRKALLPVLTDLWTRRVAGRGGFGRGEARTPRALEAFLAT